MVVRKLEKIFEQSDAQPVQPAQSDAISINGDPITASRLEAAKCPFYYWHTYINKPELKLPKNAEYHYGDTEHKQRDKAFKMRFKSPMSFGFQSKNLWADGYEVDLDEGKFGIHHPIPGKNLQFYAQYLWNSLLNFKSHPGNKKLIEHVLAQREETKKRIKKEVQEEYLKQSQLVKVTKKRLHKPTKQAVLERTEEEYKKLWPRLEQRILFEHTYGAEKYLLSSKPDFLARRAGVEKKLAQADENYSEDTLIYVDYKTHHDLMEHQFTIADAAIRHKYNPKNIIHYKNHIYSPIRRHEYEEVILSEKDFENLGLALKSFYQFTKDINKALDIRNKIEQPLEKKNQIGLDFLASDRKFANEVLDVRNFPRRRTQHCNICDLYIVGKQMRPGNTEEDIQSLIEIYWTTMALGSEKKWRELTNRNAPCGRYKFRSSHLTNE